MAQRIQHRRGTTSQWATANPILATGEIGYDLELKRFKMGDGVTAWTSLAFVDDITSADIADGSVTVAKLGAVPTTALSDVAATTATADGETLAWDDTAGEFKVTAVAPAVVTFEADGDIGVDTLTDWTDASEGSSAFDSLAILSGRVVVPDPDLGAIGGTNPAAHGAAWKDWSTLGAWTGERVSVSCWWTGERPMEATPLLHVVETGSTKYGLGVWPIADLFPGTPGYQSALSFGYIGDNNTHFEITYATAFTSLPAGLDLEDGRRHHFDLRSWDGEWSLWVDGALVTPQLLGVDQDPWMAIPAELLGSTKHGFALDNNQLDGVGGAGGARTANVGACEGPWMITPLTSRDQPIIGTSAVAGALAYKADQVDLAAHLADTTDAHDATAISYAGATGISATNVETAIDELATEKANLTGGTFTGAVTVNDGTGGRTEVGHTASTPTVRVFEAASDTQPVVSLGVIFGEGAVAFGPGGSGAIDATILRTGVGQISTGTTKLTVPTAAAGTDAVNRDTGDGRWIRSGTAAIVNADVSASAAIAGTKVDAATETTRGTVELATTAEATTGTDTARAVTPAGVDAYVDAVLAGNVTIGGDLTVNDDILTVEIPEAKATIELETNGSSVLNCYNGTEAEPRLSVGYFGAFALPILTMGPGGATAPDTTVYRSSAGVLTLVGNLIVSDASAATHAVNRQYADSRYLRPAASGPTGTVGASFPRLGSPAINAAVLSTGRISCVAVWYEAGAVVTNIGFHSATTGTTGPTNYWFGIADSSRVVRAVSADQTSAAWSGNASKVLAMGSPYTIPTAGLYYHFINVTATTPPTLVAVGGHQQLLGIAPIIAGSSNTGQTTPIAVAATLTAITAQTPMPYTWST